MIVTCPTCGRNYDDAARWTDCPHDPISAAGYCRRHDLLAPCSLCGTSQIPNTLGVVTDGDGNVATLHASSACNGPFAWLTVRDQNGREAFYHPPVDRWVAPSLHLDRATARKLADLLLAFVEGCTP